MNPSFRCGNLAWFQDYLNPIIADADTGHGGITATMKLAKMFIENGAAGIHIEAGAADTELAAAFKCSFHSNFWAGISSSLGPCG